MSPSSLLESRSCVACGGWCLAHRESLLSMGCSSVGCCGSPSFALFPSYPPRKFPVSRSSLLSSRSSVAHGHWCLAHCESSPFVGCSPVGRRGSSSFGLFDCLVSGSIELGVFWAGIDRESSALLHVVVFSNLTMKLVSDSEARRDPCLISAFF